MEPNAILALVAENRCTLALRDGELKFAPAPGIDREEKAALVALLREHKEALIVALREREEGNDEQMAVIAECGSVRCAGCYEVEAAFAGEPMGYRKLIHPPRTDERFLAWQRSWLK